MKTWNYSNVVESFSTIVNCNESLDSGDIIGGDGELNWINVRASENIELHNRLMLHLKVV